MMRKALWVGLLLLTPLAVYWQTVFHEFGFRDDYSLLREAHEEPGKLMKLTVSNGRPVYGMALDASLRPVRDVPDLPWLRLTAVALLAAVAVVLFRNLRNAGWSTVEAAAIGLGVALLPGAQVTVGWAIAWPIALALLFAVLGFFLIDAHLERSGAARLIGLAGGGFFYFLAALTYQSNALFAIVPLAALLLIRDDQRLSHARWVGLHLATLIASLAAAFVLMQLFFEEGIAPEAARMQLEPDPLLKLLWFVRQPLVNSLALFELRDRFDTSFWFWVVAVSFAAILALGFRVGARNNRSLKLRWLFCLLVLPFLGHAVSLAASSQAIGYRTVFPLSGLVLVLVVFGLRSVVHAGLLRLRFQQWAFGALLALAAVSAQRNAYTLIAVPQNREWELIQTAAQTLRLDADTDVYIIRPGIEDRSTERVFDDEFGSLSSDADWASKEMFKAALRERFPDKLPAGADLSITTGAVPPTSPGGYDVVIDLRKLKLEGDRATITVAGDAATAQRR